MEKANNTFLTRVLLCIVLFSPHFSNAQECHKTNSWMKIELSDDDFLIVLLRANRKIISESIEIYANQEQIFVPINSLNTVLKLNWLVDIDNAIVKSNNGLDELAYQFPCDFEFDLASKRDEGSNLWASDGFDIYFDINAFAKIIGADYMLDLSGSILNMDIETPIPGIEGSFDDQIPQFFVPEVISPDLIIADSYSAFTYPQINYRATGIYDRERNDFSGQLQVNSFFDLFKHDATFRLNQSEDSGNQFIRVGKSFPTSSKLFENREIRYEFGDILLQSDELVLNSKQAAGIQLFSSSPNFRRSFSTITIEEITLPGWRAQLFRNGEFLDEVFTNDDNRVVFNDVQTFFGVNQYEIKLYGPEGQQEVRTQSVNVGTNLKPGTVDFSASYIDVSQSIFNGDDEEQTFDEQFVAQIGYGINQYASAELSAYSLSGLDEEQNFLSVAINAGLGHTNIRAQVANELDAGEAYFLGVNSDLGGRLKLNFQGRFLENFNSELLPENRNLRSGAVITLNGFNKGLGWNARFSYSDFIDQQNRSQLDLRLSSRLFGGSFSTILSVNNLSNFDLLNQRVNWSKSFNGWTVSNDIGWSPLDNQRINFYNASLRWPNRVNIFNETRVVFDNNADSSVRLEHLLNWRRKEFNLRFGTFVNEDGEWGINFGITGDIEYDPFEHNTRFHRPRGTNIATVQAFAFLDENRNNVFDDFEQPLSDIQLLGDVQWRGRSTNQEGKIQVSTRRREQDIHIDEASLPDLFMRPAQDLIQVNTHAGGRAFVTLPVVTFNEIEGAIYISKGDISRGFGGLTLNLVDAQNKVVATTTTEVDGFFFMTGIDPGEYQLELNPAQLHAQNLVISNQPQIINAPNEGDIVRINDIVLINKELQNTVKATTHSAKQPVNDDAALNDANTIASSSEVTSRYHQVIPFYVQLGVFKKPSSIVEVIKYLPSEQFDLKIYRDHQTALSYVVLGPFDNEDQALNASHSIRQYANFSGAFIRPAHKFHDNKWTLEYTLMEPAQHIRRSHQFIYNNSGYYCQLGSYQSLTSIPEHLLNSLHSLLLTRRVVNALRYYTLYRGPVATRQDCHDNISINLSRGNGFAVPQKSLINSLLKLKPPQL